MIQYKIDVLFELKNKGFTTYKLEKEKILRSAVIDSIRKKRGINFETMNTLCKLLQCQPGDIIEFIDDPKESNL